MNGDLLYSTLTRMAKEAAQEAAPHPVDSPDFAYLTGRSRALAEAAMLYVKMKGPRT